MRALPALILILATACTAPPSERTPTTATTTMPALARPLRLPTVDAGAPCPVTSPRPWSVAGVAGAVLGDGPLYPVADYFQRGPVLRLRDDDRLSGGGYEKKVRWIGVGYTGPVFVRAARIDGPGSASVNFSYTGEQRDGGYLAELRAPDSDLPATTTVSGPGCYAYQVDGATFSTTIVFEAR